tara:strand:+ start:34762 stop:35565 length:804 start_codon:yes stop_codon:yes gene_type:complete
MPKKVRLDLHLLTQGLVSSRQQAQNLIRAGKVRTQNGLLLDKPGQEVLDTLEVCIKNPPRFVSRGGEKLIAALNTFPINVKGRICIDCGISTGGFTDCLLKKGASRVYGIDVGYGQVDWGLRNDPRVLLKERTNLRTLTHENLYEKKDPWPNFAVADLSFISLTLVLPSITALLKKEHSESILLIKPQFEVGRGKVGKGGVVRDADSHLYALNKVISKSTYLGWETKGVIPSPITGPAGNHEYLLWLAMGGESNSLDLNKLVSNTLN